MKSFSRSNIFLAFLISLSSLPIFSSAGVVTAAFTIQARYQQTCTIQMVPILDFGTITSNTAVVLTSDTLVVACGLNSQVPFGVWAPLSANANGAQRRMKNRNVSANNYLNYDVLIGDSGSTFLPTTSTTTGFASPVAASRVGILLRASIPTGQTLTQGYYTDDLVLTVSY